MNIIINLELRDYIDPLTTHEYLALERSLLKEGCRDALVLWGETLIDGHNRYAICQKHNIPFQTKQNDSFQSVEDVMLWMIDNHLARRSVSSFQRGVLALRKKEIITTRRKDKTSKEKAAEAELAAKEPDPVSVETRDEIAKVAGLSKPAVAQIEKIRKGATPELVEAVRAGTISINTAATISSLPSDQQVAAVAGGKKELQQAARQLRQVRAPRSSSDTEASGTETTSTTVSTNNTSTSANSSQTVEVSELERLRAENHDLKIQIAELKNQLAARQASD
jgi:ParB-like chromosome segregation protein Spo0J